MPTGDGQAVELGYGNVFLSFSRLLGDSWELATGKKSLRPGAEGNPFLRWLSYRKSPVVDAVWQTFSGEDFRGMPTGFLEAAGRASLPMPVEPSIDYAIGKLNKNSAVAETAGSFLGLNAFTKETQSMNERARSTFGKELSQLKLSDRMQLANAKAKDAKPSLDAQEVVSLSATKNEFERRREVLAAMPKEVRKALEAAKVSLPAFRTGFEINGKEVPLTQEERVQHQRLIIDEYKQALARLMASPRFEEFKKDGSLQKRVNVIISDANARARAKLKQKMVRQGLERN